MSNCYVYVLCDPMTRQPIYVGKGVGDRAFHHQDSRSKGYIGNKVRQLKRETGLDPWIFYHMTDLSDAEAFSEERKLIKQLGRRDNGTGILYNLTDGGEGPVNRKLSAQHKARLSAVGKGKKLSSETKQKLSDSMKGRANTWGSKIAASLKGTPHTPERRKNISAARKRYYENLHNPR